MRAGSVKESGVQVGASGGEVELELLCERKELSWGRRSLRWCGLR